MRKYRVRTWIVALLVALLGSTSLMVTPVLGQARESRSFSIRDGAVFLDGRQLSADELPPSLDTRDVQLHYTFSGDVRPIIDINGTNFVIESDGIREAEEAEEADADGVSVFLRQNVPVRAPAPDRIAVIPDISHVDITAFAAPHAESIEQQARELAEQVVHFQQIQSRLQEQLSEQQVEELNQAAQQIGRQAAQAVQAAEALPFIEVQHYLDGIQREDRELYEQLVEEREMERETIRLAGEIRSMQDGPERTARTNELRSKLDEIFELKQMNRKREIDQFEKRLNELQQRLQDRERQREQIIEGRLRQLLDDENATNW